MALLTAAFTAGTRMALLYIHTPEAWTVRWEATLAQRNEHRCLVHEDAVRAGVYTYNNKTQTLRRIWNVGRKCMGSIEYPFEDNASFCLRSSYRDQILP